MADPLYPYYERELHVIRELARDFGKRFPAAAGRLLLDETRSADPHVERLIESFALLAGRVRHKLDDDFPELTDALLGILYPHYLAPIPSMAIAEFELDPKMAQLPNGLLLPRGSRLRSQAIAGVVCRFRTTYPLTLWPVKVNRARILRPPLPTPYRSPQNAAGALVIELEAMGGLPFSEVALERLRVHLAGDDALTTGLYQLILHHTVQVMFRPLDGAGTDEAIALEPSEALTDVGFGADEGMLPRADESAAAYHLLTEYFAFPAKFLFFDLGGFDRVRAQRFKKRLEAVFFFDRLMSGLEQAVNARTFRLGCAPIVNLFEHTAEPITLRGTEFEHRVVPDAAHPLGMEIYSVDAVVGTDVFSDREVSYRPFFAHDHGVEGAEAAAGRSGGCWLAARRPSIVDGDDGTDVFLSLVDPSFNPRSVRDQVLTIRTTCTNRDIPARAQLAGQRLELALDLSAPVASIRCVEPATSSIRPPGRRGGYWRLISHLSVNHLSLSGPSGLVALKEILRLYDFSEPRSGGQYRAINRQLVDGISAMSTRRVVGQTGSEVSSGFCRGIEVTLEFDAHHYVGSGVYLFACVLERFLGLYASINSFSQLVAKIKQEEGILKRWPPRAAYDRLL